MKPRWQDRVTRVDIAALLVFLAVWVYYAVMVRYGVCFADESFYVTVAERFVQGERPLVDEWHLSQLSALFLCLPYKLYVAVTGSTAGILLCLRYLFLAFNAAVYWFVYIRLRSYKWPALFAALLLCAYVPFAIYACNYYTVPIRLLTVVCILLSDTAQKPLPLLCAGVLFACAVICQPGLALMYVLYSAAVWVCFLLQKKNRRLPDDFAPVLSVRTWGFFSLSIALCAAVFTSWLLSRSGLKNILASLPYLLLTDPEYDYSAGGSAWSVFFRKLAEAAGMYGGVCWIGALLLLALSVLYACGVFRKRRESVRKVLFIAACALWIVSCVKLFMLSKADTADPFFVLYPAPLFWFGFVCFLLGGRRNKRLLLFWIVGLASSVCIDFFSDVTVAIGCPVGYIASFVFIGDLVREIQSEPSEQKTRKKSAGRKKAAAVRLCAGITCAGIALWSTFVVLYAENTSVAAHFVSAVPLKGETLSCTDGPCRALRYPQAYARNYSDKLSDIDTIRVRQPKNLYVCNIAPELYLYADLPYATYSAYAFGKTAFLERELLYWNLHPEKYPECIFVAFDKVGQSESAADTLLPWIHESFDPLCTYTLEAGKSGYILYVSGWDAAAKVTERIS